MKRELVLIRHTKSSWADLGQPDFERPLKKDRVDDARNMAAHLKKLKIQPDLIICSTAKRTRQTAEYFCERLDYTYNNIQFEDRIYESSAEDILEVIRETDAAINTLFIIGHNPSLTFTANYFNGISVLDLPTTGVVWLEFECDDWQLHKTTACKQKGFLTPKTI